MMMCVAYDDARLAEVREAEVRQRVRHALERLCVEEVRQDVLDPEGYPVVEPPLVAQLFDARVPSGESGGGGRGTSFSPVAVEAVDMLKELSDDLIGLVPENAPVGSALDTLRRALPTMSADDVAVVDDRFSPWPNRIINLLRPPRRTPLDVRCPVCGLLRVVQILPADDGADDTAACPTTQSPCLYAVWDRDRVDRVECANPRCGSTWSRARVWEVIPESRRAMVLSALA